MSFEIPLRKKDRMDKLALEAALQEIEQNAKKWKSLTIKVEEMRQAVVTIEALIAAHRKRYPQL